MDIIQRYWINLFWSFCLILSSFENKSSKYLKFSGQEGYHLSEASNYATLISGDLDVLLSNKFTICSSIFIGFFRGKQAFYTLRKNDHKTLFFTLSIENQDKREETYSSDFNYFHGSLLSIDDADLKLRPHDWSHACTTIDVESGSVLVVINGIITQNSTIRSKDFTDNVHPAFENNLVLGINQQIYAGGQNILEQSEATVKNVNVFSVPFSSSQMINITSTGLFQDGDIVSWVQAQWSLSGSVELIPDTEINRSPAFPHLYEMGVGFHSFDDCLNLCPRVQSEGRLPLTHYIEDAENLAQQMGQQGSNDFIWASFTYNTPGNFTDHFMGTPLNPDLWTPGQPNGGLKQQCTMWMKGSTDGKLFDLGCQYWGKHVKCLCQFDGSPILRLRGLCQGSNIDTHYSMKDINGSVVFKGIIGTEIKILLVKTSLIKKWTLNVNILNTSALTYAKEMSFVLGRQNWNIEGEVCDCNDGEAYTAQLKMSGCNTDGEFTCDDGQCVTMEQRCDQIANCKDGSDEENCQVLVTRKGYNRKVPPFTVIFIDNSIIPVQLNVSIDLLKIVNMVEENHKIDLQFQITLEWRESNRVVYHNLKPDTSLNALSESDVSRLWLPLVIYDNTDQKEVTRLGEYGNGEWHTPISIMREGNFTRSGIDIVDETEIFEGSQNTISMQQVYSWEFQCKYTLQYYPFDTQVTLH